MLKKILLPAAFIVLAYSFWLSPDFKEIGAGVSIFLFGMLALEEGFRAFSGGAIERILQRSTDRLHKSLVFGILLTTLMQSSSLVSVITISFVSAGMIGLKAGLGIIYGANLGTTTGAWLVAGFGLKVKISAYALPMLVFGIILVFQKSKSLKGSGYILSGLGFLFLGIHYMKEGFEAFKTSFDLSAYAVPGYPGLFLYVLIGVVATVVMQSSHATLVLIITALASAQVSYENALALVIGANVGTTITAVIGATSANVEGKRLAGGHVLFKVATGVVAIVAIRPLVVAVDGICGVVGIGPQDYTLKLAVFHTVFNTIGVALMAPLINVVERGLLRLLPDQKPERTQPMHLSDASLDFEHTAIEAARLETQHLYNEAFVTIAHGIELRPNEILSDLDLAQLVREKRPRIEIDMAADYENTVKVLYGAITTFVTKAQAQHVPEVGLQLSKYRIACRHIVETVKSVQQIRDNVSEYTHGDNPHIKQAYEGIRVMLGIALRHVAAIQEASQDEEPVSIAELDSLRLEVKEADVLTSGTVDDLIRDDLITPRMATSLMNDSAYAFYAVNHLVEMTACLYGTEDPDKKAAEESVALSDAEVGALARETSLSTTVAQPMYITDEALTSAQSILDAARLETENLYDKALTLLSHGIDLRRWEVLSDQDLAELIESQKEPIVANMDEHYEQTVKVIYAAITRFVSKSRTLLPFDKAEQLLQQRLAARDVVEAVKAVKHLRKNLSVYAHSENQHIRRAYNDIRIVLASVIRELQNIRENPQRKNQVFASLEQLRQTVKRSDSLSNGSLDMLVREDLISPWMASSLMNDSAYAQHASEHLIQMTERLLPASQTSPPANNPASDNADSTTD